MDDEQTTTHPRRAELIERIRRSRLALEETIRSLSDAQLAARGSSDWSIKDHLAHLATWELGIAELLRRHPRFAAMGVEEAVAQGKDEDEVNALIYEQHAGLSSSEVLEQFEAAHRQLLEALETLSDEDLHRPYAYYVPDSNTAPQDPVVGWIVGNTYHHFDEHHDYIRAMLENDR